MVLCVWGVVCLFGSLLKPRVGTAKGRSQEPLKKNSLEKDPSTFERRSHQMERWRVQEKWKAEKWRVKYRKRKMVEEVQRAHQKFGEVRKVALSLSDYGTEMAPR